MPTLRFLFTREAIRAWRRLPAHVQQLTNEKLLTLDFRQSKQLLDSEYRRTRVTRKYRIIWRPGGTDVDFIIARLGPRNESLYKLQLSSQARHMLKIHKREEDEADIACAEHAEKIGYRYDDPRGYFSDQGWQDFMFRAYRWTPSLSPNQGKVLQQQLYIGRSNEPCLVLQCAPGSGKTTWALALIEHYLRHTRQGEKRYAALLVPPKLAEEFVNAEVPNRICNQTQGRFFLGTFEEWLDQLFPELGRRRLNPKEELQLLKALLPANDDPTPEDLVYYQAVILTYDLPRWSGLKTAINLTKDLTGGIGEALSPVRKKLRDGAVPTGRFLERTRRCLRAGTRRGDDALLSRAQLPGEMLERIWSGDSGQNIESDNVLLIVDEAQERLVTEIFALKELVDCWRSEGRSVKLILLGDLNQRISPTAYLWSHLNHRIVPTGEISSHRGFQESEGRFRENYRNSRAILRLARSVWEKFNDFPDDARRPPNPASPEDAIDKDGKVQLVVFPTPEEATAFLRRTNNRCTGDQEHRILRKLANNIVVLCRYDLISSWSDLGNLRPVTAAESKGREFGSAIAFCLFRDLRICPQHLFELYTLITRVESHLLLVMTTEEHERAKGMFDLGMCEVLSRDREDEAVELVRSAAGESITRELSTDLVNDMLEELLKGRPFDDTYGALRLLGTKSVEEFEQRAMEGRGRWNHETVARSAVEVPMRCLALRAAGRSWESAEAAHRGLASEDAERLIEAAASQLTEKGRDIEGARLRAHYLGPGNWKDYEARGLKRGRPEDDLGALLRAWFFESKKRHRLHGR